MKLPIPHRMEKGMSDDELRVSGLTLTSQKTQTYEDDSCDNFIDISFRVPCLHHFSLSHLLSKCTTPSKEEKMFSHFTGFDSYPGFKDTLKFILPNLDRKLLTFWDSTAGKSSVIDTEKLFEENESDLEEDRDEDEPEIRETKTRPSAHKLQVEDEFLMVLMKLRMGLSNIDLGERFNLSDSAVSNILLTWLNYIYEVLGSLKIWPHRDKYPNNTVIIDATELKIQVPSALQKHSESYSSYKSHTTSKSLIGVDPNGGIMFISQLYEGSISDKQIVKRSGFLETLKKDIGRRTQQGRLNYGR